MTNNALIRLQEVTRRYTLDRTEVWALRGVDLTIARGEFTALCGRSGSGKTTLLNIIGCLDRPTSGGLEIGGRRIQEMSDVEQSNFRSQNLGFIFQTFNLFPVLSALENVEYPLLNLGLKTRERRERAREALAAVGLGRHESHRPSELSGGQRQRVAIARAIVHRPSLIIADEPTANLDRATAEGILELLGQLNRQLNVTCLIATHDPMVMAVTRRQVHMSDGLIEAPADVTGTVQRLVLPTGRTVAA